MWNFLFKHREGQFLIAGTIFLVLGFVLFSNPLLSRLAFYLAIFFLGFFATKNAIVHTISDGALNVDLLMVLAAIGASFINYESEGATLLFIFAAAEVLEDYVTGKSSQAIEALMGNVPNTAQLVQANGEVVEVPVSDLQLDQTVVVAKGAQIPIDGIIDRESVINEAALTGESVPVEKKAGNEVFAGTINEGQSFQVKVNKLSNETVFSNIVRMVEEAQSRPSRISKTIDRIESRYVLAVLILVPVFILALIFIMNLSFQEAFYRGMVLLTVASPCALVASATPATLSAISNGAKNGILFKGGAAMEVLSTMNKLYTDKTGTLTFGAFEIVDYEIDDEILKEVVFMEQVSSHPIAKTLVNHFRDVEFTGINQREAVEEISGIGVKKGDLVVGKPSSFESYADPMNYRSKADSVNTVIFAGMNNEIVGYFSFEDKVRHEATSSINKFQDEGIEVVLITGDNQQTAEKVANEVGIKQFKASCLPADKINAIRADQANDFVVGMIGDGINDAPALANADIGIAMGSGSSSAMESAEVVIVQNDLSKLFDSYLLSNKLNKIIKQNIIFAISVIIILISLNLFGLLALPTAVVFHEGSTILVILNGLRLLSMKNLS